MSFAHPLWLAGVALVTVLFAWLYVMAERRRGAQALLHSNLDFAFGAMRPSRVPAALLFAAWFLGVATLAASIAGPRFTARVPTQDGWVVICVDTSGSMRAQDVAPTRWDAAKAAAQAFVDSVPSGTRVGIVSFSSGANLIAAPSGDLNAVREAIDRIPPPNGATAIGDALELAAAQLPEKGRRAIVLMTDGVNNRGADPVRASQTIGARGISISTVGIGTSGSGQLIPGTNQVADLDDETLRAIAQNGRGSYAQAGDAGGLSETFRRLALETVWEKRNIDGSFPFALGGGALVLAAFLVGFAGGRFP